MSKQRKNLAQVRVASPCAAEWDAMKGNDAVRFCDHCAKHVHNLSAMTPRRAQRLIEVSGDSLCVRYYPRPNGAPKVGQQKLYPLQRQASRLAAGAFTAVLSMAANLPAPLMAAASPAARATQTGYSGYQPQSASGDACLNGVVRSDDEEKPVPIPRALVRLINRETNERHETNSNEAGEFTLENLPAGTYRMLVKAEGFGKYRDKTVTVSGGEAKKLDVSLSLVYGAMGGAMVIIETENELMKAISANDLPKVQELLKVGGSNLNTVDKIMGSTPLMAAVERGNLTMAELLIDAGAEVDQADEDGRTALLWLDEDSTPELAQLLIKKGAQVKRLDDYGRTALHNAAYWAEDGVIEVLLKAKAEINAADDDGETALMQAAQNGKIGTIKLLLKAGANSQAVDDEGNMAWHFLNNEATPELVKLFLDAGIDIEQRNKAGQTLLLRLAGAETMAVEALVKAGANVNAADDIGATPLMRAASNNQIDNVRLLIKAKAMVNARTHDGMTPLIYGAVGMNTDLVRLLLKAGADINALTNEGYTGLSYALTNEDEDMVKLLKSKGGVGEPLPKPKEDDSADGDKP